jgi:hypothetical protein
MAKTRPKTKAELKARKRKTDDLEQYERFRQFALEHETDESEEEFSRAFKTIIRKPHLPSPSRS